MGIADKLKGMMSGHEDQVKEGTDKAADFADEKTEGKYGDQIGTAKGKVNEQLGDPPPEGGQPPPA